MKLCKDCRWYQDFNESGHDRDENRVCRNETVRGRSPVTGELFAPVAALVERSRFAGECGTQADLWEQG